MKQTSIYFRELWKQLSTTLDEEAIDLRSIEDWVNDGRIMAKKGTLPTDEQLREALMANLQQSVFANGFQQQQVIADNLLENMGYSESFEGLSFSFLASLRDFSNY